MFKRQFSLHVVFKEHCKIGFGFLLCVMFVHYTCKTQCVCIYMCGVNYCCTVSFLFPSVTETQQVTVSTGVYSCNCLESL